MRQSDFDEHQPADSPDPEDPDWLRDVYHNQDMTLAEMAELAGVGYGKIHYQMEKHGIDRRTSGESRDLRDSHKGGYSEIQDHNRKEWLETRYVDQHMTVNEMADEAGVTDATIIRNMDEHGLDRRPSYVTRVMRDPGAGFIHADHAGGYETIKHSVDDHTYNYKLHRLLAMAVFGIEEVKGKMIHHKNGIPWDNRPDNLELLNDQSEHATHHNWGENF